MTNPSLDDLAGRHTDAAAAKRVRDAQYPVDARGRPMTPERQRFTALVIIALGLAGMAWAVWQVRHEGKFGLYPSAGGPLFAVIGVGLLFLPDPKVQAAARGEDPAAGKASLSPAWWAVFAVAAVAAFAFPWALTRGWLSQ